MRVLLVLTMILGSTEAEAGPRKVRKQSSQQVVAPPPSPATAHESFVVGDYDKAVSLYSKILASPSLPRAQRSGMLTARGYAYLRMRRPAEAVADFRQAVALDPTDEEASDALFVLQTKPPSDATTLPPPDAAHGWGALARLPGRNWIQSGKKATRHVRYEWGKVGVSMQFAGRDNRGHRIEGRYFIDPGRNSIRATYTYKGKVFATDLTISGDHFIETVPGKGGARQVATTQTDGSFAITAQKLKSSKWQDTSTTSLTPASEQMIASLAWPDEPLPDKPSFLDGMLSAMKEGALAGFQDGMQEGVQSATAYRVRQVSGTKECRTITGDVVQCP